MRSRIEAEILLQLARTVKTIDAAWTDFVVASVVDFAVWGDRPTGYVDADMARWLVAVLSEGGRTRLSRRIAREIIKEAQHVDAELAEFARKRWIPQFSWTGWSGVAGRPAWAPA